MQKVIETFYLTLPQSELVQEKRSHNCVREKKVPELAYLFIFIHLACNVKYKPGCVEALEKKRNHIIKLLSNIKQLLRFHWAVLGVCLKSTPSSYACRGLLF